VPNCTVLNLITLNWTMQSQTMACIAKSSCTISDLQRFYAALSGGHRRFGTTYQSHLQESRNPKEQSTTEVNWHNLLFLGLIF